MLFLVEKAPCGEIPASTSGSAKSLGVEEGEGRREDGHEHLEGSVT